MSSAGHEWTKHEREGWSVCSRCGMVRNYDREQTTCSGALPKIRQRSEIEDCGQDGVCKLSPGCNRHWEERNRELVRELEEARAFLRRTAMSGGSIVSSAAMTVTQIAIARAADRLLVTPDGYGFVYVPGPRFCACGRTETGCDQSRAACSKKTVELHVTTGMTMTTHWAEHAPEDDDFGSMKRKSAKGPKPFQDSAPMMRPGFSFRAGNTDRLHVVIRFPGVRSSHPSTDRLVLASTALGGYSSSRLFQSLREDKGLCYSVGTGLHSLSDCGAVFVSLSMDRSKFRRAMDALLQEMDSFRKAQKRDEIGRAKNFLRGSRTLEMDSPMTAAQDFVYQTFIDGSYEDPAKRMQKMMQIGMEEVRDVVRKHLDPFVMHVAVVGPEDARDEVNKVMDRIQKKI